MLAEKISKSFFLYLSKNKMLNKTAKKWGRRLGASQVVAGVSNDSVVGVVRKLNEKGLVCTVDHLGEFILNKEEALEATNECIATLQAIAEHQLHCNLSLKLTQLGLDIDYHFCLSNMKKVMEEARKHHTFVRIDMEDSSRCKATLNILKELRQSDQNIGTVIQAYLYRAKEDVLALKGVPLRLVKGAYKETEEIAFQDKQTIDENYLSMIKEHLQSGSYTAIATHDHNIIAKVKTFCLENGIPKTQFEFQMLYGFRTDMQEQIVKEGYTMRVYVPYGKDWYGYFMRRLAERPQNVSFAIKGLISK